MPPHVLLPVLGSSHTSHQFYLMYFTGCRSPRELSSRSLCCMAFDCIRGMGPTYFTRVCVPVSMTTLPGPVFVLLNVFVPRTWTKLGTRSFLVPASVVWSSLLSELRSTSVTRDTFRSTLKSHFYAEAYPPIFINTVSNELVDIFNWFSADFCCNC